MFATLNALLHGNLNGNTGLFLLGMVAMVAVYFVAFASPARMGSR